MSAPQAEFVERTRINLYSGDPPLMSKYLDLKTRDKRLDGTVKKAIAAGKPLDKATLDKVLIALAGQQSPPARQSVCPQCKALRADHAS